MSARSLSKSARCLEERLAAEVIYCHISGQGSRFERWLKDNGPSRTVVRERVGLHGAHTLIIIAPSYLYRHIINRSVKVQLKAMGSAAMATQSSQRSDM